jgi:hypothetical protein
MEDSETMQACVVPTLSSVLTLLSLYWDTIGAKMRVQLSPLNGGYSGGLFYHLASVKPDSAYVNQTCSHMIS